MLTTNTALILISAFVLVLLVGALLSRMARPSGDVAANRKTVLIDQVNELLPQTQCAQCGYPGCRPYAEAIVEEHIPINRCPPGGKNTITQLAALLGTDVPALDEQFGIFKAPQVARILEADCIGCTLCIKACPVDAIVGANKLMHTVMEDECTGCELCIPPCPVDCIILAPIDTTPANWAWPQPQ